MFLTSEFFLYPKNIVETLVKRRMTVEAKTLSE